FVSDGTASDGPVTVDITVNAVNDDPNAVNDGTFNTAFQTALVLDAADLLVNDTDVDGDTLSVTSVQGAVNGTVSLAGGMVTFTPDAGYSGPASFTYTIDDGNTGVDTAAVFLTVGTAANTQPVAQDDSITTDEDTAVSGNVLADNGNGADSDADSDPLTVTAVNGNAGDVGSQVALASGALLTVNGNGTFDYDPNGQFESLGGGQSVPDTFTYAISDGNGGTDTATITITVNGVNDAPTGTGLPSDVTVSDNVLSDVDLSAVTLADVDSSSLTVTMTVNDGTLAASSSGGVSATLSNGDQTLTLTGTTAALNAWLDVTSNVQYLNATGDTGNNADALAVTVNDNDGSGDVAVGSVNIDVTPPPGPSDNDLIFAGTGNNWVNGGVGDDIIFGGPGNDSLHGGLGDDFLYGGPGNDNLRGNEGNDHLFGNNGDDKLFGGTGNDVMFGGGGADMFIFEANFGQDKIGGFESQDLIHFKSGVLYDTHGAILHGLAELKAVTQDPNSHVDAVTFIGGKNVKIGFDSGDSITLWGAHDDWVAIV
ncbi:MAG: tandem-95 repeat protein, partial [Rhodobiaceae bacterium]|nr:tandem-95 repeat protein [Rhodobiaceae bacterium]